MWALLFLTTHHVLAGRRGDAVVAGSETEDGEDAIALASILYHYVSSAFGAAHRPSYRSFCPSGLSLSSTVFHLLIHIAFF